jgi:deazaflavin-dependent oxidoreductase (nitroreductase family)
MIFVWYSMRKNNVLGPAARRHTAILAFTRVLNPLILRLAGSRVFPLYGVLQHRGRRSGKPFRTPLVVRPTVDGFIVPMPWGERTDWYRNVRAAGQCGIRWKGRDYPVVPSEVIDAAGAQQLFGAFERAFMSGLAIEECLRLRHQSPS